MRKEISGETLRNIASQCGAEDFHAWCQLPTAEAVGLSVDSRSNSTLEWTLDTSLTFNVPDCRAR